MTFVTPYVTDKSTIYKGDSITTTLSLAISIIDDFTKKEATGHLKVIIKERNIVPIKNLSGYYIFTDLADITYTVSIESELYFPEERVIDISKINLTMSHYQMKTSSLDHIKPNTLFAAKSMTANGVTV